MDEFAWAQEISKMLADAMKKRGYVTLLIAGRTGVGKSTLVNAVFQGNMATTGQGRPVTQHTREYVKEGVPLSLIDTRGLEAADFETTLAEVAGVVDVRAREEDVSRHVHAAWVCIAEDSRRVEDAEIQLVSMLESKEVPVVAVITKARADQGFRATVQELLPQAKNVARVRAVAEEYDDGHTVAPMGLVELVELTSEVIPEGQRNAFSAAQRVSLDQKKARAHKVVLGAATAAATAAAAPIPGSDWFTIVPIQVGMLAGVSAAFGLPIQEGTLKTLVASAVTGSGATLAGRAIVTGLLKLIPGAGTVAGGAIAATTAYALTVAFGEAYIATLARLYAQKHGEAPSATEVAEAFKKELAARRSPKG